METILRRNTLRLERDGAVGKLWLDRPEKLNAFTIEMWDEMAELGAELVADPGDLRALVVIGEGRAFSSGIDTALSPWGALGGGRPRARPAPFRHEGPFAAEVLGPQTHT